MDFGFVRASDAKGMEKVTISREGYSSYLLIVDKYSCMMWVFLTKSKAAPVKIIDTFLSAHKNTTGLCRVQTDQGRELARSAEFHETLQKHNYTLETTALESSFQNAIVEHPHQTLGNMMRSMLKVANMSNIFWANALLHAVYIKNCLLHTTISVSPYEKYTGTKPDISHLRVFGSCVIVKNQGDCPGKLNQHITIGTFLRFVGNKSNIIFYDNKTHQTQSAQHLEFNETHYHYSNQPPCANCLKNIATAQAEQKYHDINQPKITPPYPLVTTSNVPYDKSDHHAAAATSQDTVVLEKTPKFYTTHPAAVLPFKATSQSVGYNLTTISTASIPPYSQQLFSTGITFQCPTNHYSRIAPCSSIAMKGIHMGAGVVALNGRTAAGWVV